MDKSLLGYLRENKKMRKQRPAGYGITAREYAEAESVSVMTAGRALSEMALLGVLKFEDMLMAGKVTRVYTRVKK